MKKATPSRVCAIFALLLAASLSVVQAPHCEPKGERLEILQKWERTGIFERDRHYPRLSLPDPLFLTAQRGARYASLTSSITPSRPEDGARDKLGPRLRRRRMRARPVLYLCLLSRLHLTNR